jgi:hypothetical protein
MRSKRISKVSLDVAFKIQASLKDTKPFSLGIPSGIGQRKMKNNYEASTKIHGGIKQDSRVYEVLWHGNQMENKDLTRMPIEGRIYHIKYDTLIDKEC